MAWPDKVKLVNSSCVVNLGETVTHERKTDGVRTDIAVVLLRGEFFERNNPGYIAEVFFPSDSLPLAPIKGDLIIFDNRIHEAMAVDPDSPGAFSLKLRYVQDVI